MILPWISVIPLKIKSYVYGSDPLIHQALWDQPILSFVERLSFGGQDVSVTQWTSQ